MGIQDTMDSMSDSMKDRMEELSNREKAGELDDKGREELAMLRSKMNM